MIFSGGTLRWRDMLPSSRTLGAAGQNRWRVWVVAGALVVLGFALRAAYYHKGYGHPDEAITVEVVRHMRLTGDWDTNWSKANLTPDLRYDQYNFSSHLYATFFFYRAVKVLPGTAAWRDPEEGFWVYRFFSVLLATVAVWQTWVIARGVGGTSTAILATVFAAVAPLLVQDAHYSRPEAFVTALTLLVVWWCWPRERFRSAAVVGSAFVMGLLVACKISMLLLAWLPLVPLAGAWRSAPRRWRTLAALPLALGAGFAVGAPGAVAHPVQFIHGAQQLMAQYAGAHPPHGHHSGAPVGDLLLRYFVATLGAPMLVAGALGAVTLLRQRRRAEFALLAGPVILFMGYFATRGTFFERNVSHVLPLLLILAALGVVETARWCEKWNRIPAPVWLSGLALLLVIRSLAVTGPLLWVEFSGRGVTLHDNFERDLRARHPGAQWQEAVLLSGDPFVELSERLRSRRGPVLLRVSDYADEWTALHLGLLAARFVTEPVADYPGTFPGMPPCTLLTYHSSRDRYYLVTGQR